ncbi:MoxR family ATPase [Marinihelvus fidelis]|uniref:MoxR family ATPase n=1 Tax=Marinihelvus fidelis TaxID=2613842 RepID=A0A5N0T919_9GAMM|nr:MoxR family ATPase [Marinihelvus fidelis]KAA9131450.1 MoxR family ATPase [Marinihelvus fidelis]
MNEQELEVMLGRVGRATDEIGKVVVGQRQVVEEMLISLMAGGHCILEGVPGLAKTLMVSTLAKTLDLGFRRVQFTPDLMPSDIIGTEILEEDHATGKRFFKFQQGPVFTNILLADEINRTPPKTQAALLEAMQEHSVSYGGESRPLPAPFFVLATQNPVEQAGTYPLPEAQLDRFLMFIRVSYPDIDEEVDILERTTSGQRASVEKSLDGEDMLALQALVRDVEISPALLRYVADIVRATRPQDSGIDTVQHYLRWGAGPRAGQALVLCAKAHAVLRGRLAVTLDDLRAVAPATLRHRLLRNFQAEADGVSTDDVVARVLEKVAEPASPLG